MEISSWLTLGKFKISISIKHRSLVPLLGFCSTERDNMRHLLHQIAAIEAFCYNNIKTVFLFLRKKSKSYRVRISQIRTHSISHF
ncbi:unnamed protein product [Brassica rapa subsp. narinosa]|uniref:(rape) hypothetical protein n=1 Tax=Brassica napus TaxID=3708 RepID=A0A816WC42_BRANA|nr:unnamed protein product [Brassica napus]